MIIEIGANLIDKGANSFGRFWAPIVDCDVDKAMEYGRHANPFEKQRVLCIHIDSSFEHGVDSHCIFRTLENRHDRFSRDTAFHLDLI